MTKNKIALITGGTKGIGRAIANALAKKDVRLFINYANDEDSAKKTKRELNATIIRADLTTFEGANIVLNKIDTIDYAIFNVGITDRTPFGNVMIDEWEKVIRTNLTIPFFMIQQLKNKLNPNGRIIFITSISGIIPDASSIAYGVSKAGSNMLAQYLAKEFAQKKITVNAVAPAYTNTDWHKNKSKAQIKRIQDKNLLKRFAEPEEIAKAVMMIIENDYITGQVIRVCGGFGLA